MTSKNWSGAVRWINLLLPGQKKIYQWRGKCSGQVSKNVSFNSLWPSDANWWQRFGSTLAQVMACCLAAPSHYLNQCWFIISEVQRHGTWKKFRERCPNHQSLKWTWNTNHSSKSLLKSPRGQWVNHCHWEGVACRIKTGSGGVCCHNARGRVRNRKSNPDGVAGGIWRTVRTSPSALWQQTLTDRS